MELETARRTINKRVAHDGGGAGRGHELAAAAGRPARWATYPAAREQPVVTHVPEPTWVCDSSPATESLGDPANPRLGATYLPRLAWVRADLEPLLAGQLSRVIAAWAA
jgi:hypothetical protein